MAELKTRPTTQDPRKYLDSIPDERRRADGYALLDLFRQATGEEPVMWGDRMVGFGTYHYKSERSRQEGDWPLAAFSIGKRTLTLYVMAGNQDNPELARLGKHTSSVGCLYINRLADVDPAILGRVVRASYEYTKATNAPAQ